MVTVVGLGAARGDLTAGALEAVRAADKVFVRTQMHPSVQNLKDAGCSGDTIACCMACLDGGKKEELIKRLEQHREGLLQKIHEGERQIDCLDYLVYQIDRC